MKTFKKLLIKMDACRTGRDWVGDMSVETFVATCERGDWMLWLAQELGLDDRLLILANARCALTVRHLMSDSSLNACLVAEQFGLGEASRKELDAAAAATDSAAYASYAADVAAADAADDNANVAAVKKAAFAAAAFAAAASYAPYSAYTAYASADAAACLLLMLLLLLLLLLILLLMPLLRIKTDSKPPTFAERY